MNNQPQKNSSWIWIIGIIAVAGAAYFWYNGSTAPASDLDQQDAANEQVGAQVLALLNQIQSLNINPAIFSDPAYLTLRDFSVLIPPVNVGRPNPFAPLPGYQAQTAATAQTGH